MAAILIREVPEELHRWLKVEAARAGHTLEQECREKLMWVMQRANDGRVSVVGSTSLTEVLRQHKGE